MPYAITETGWRGIEEGWAVDPGETYVEELPDWLTEKVAVDEMVRDAKASLSSLVQDANTAISPLQAGVDLEEISDADRDRWRAWKRYLIALSKTPEREGWPANPDWPATPQS